MRAGTRGSEIALKKSDESDVTRDLRKGGLAIQHGGGR